MTSSKRITDNNGVLKGVMNRQCTNLFLLMKMETVIAFSSKYGDVASQLFSDQKPELNMKKVWVIAKHPFKQLGRLIHYPNSYVTWNSN